MRAHALLRRPLRLLLLLAVGLVATPFGGGPAAAIDGPHDLFATLPWRNTFLVGAAAVDVTPPLDGTAPNPAACAGAEAYTGKHLLSLEEAYTDVNGNGRYDRGEPFLDCPVHTVEGGTLPPDGRWDGIYLGGGDCCNRRPTAVLDPLWARTIVVASRDKRISITSVDNEGVFKEIWDRVRAKVRADGVPLDDMIFSSTHDESAPDTIGITGPSNYASGVDPFYVEFLVERTASSIEQAAASLRRATIAYGAIRPDDMTTCWSSYPFVADEQIGVMQATDLQTGKPIVTLVNYGIHAEELGFSSNAEDRLHLSSDWHHFARQALEARYGGLAVTVGGAMGSVEMPQVYPAARDLTPVPLYSSQGNGGCRTIYATDATREPYGYDRSTRARGERIAGWVERALAGGAVSRSGVVDVKRKTLLVPLDNALFAFAGSVGIISGKDLYLDGVKIDRPESGSVPIPNQFQTDVAWLRIGDGEFVTAPGEVFPYTYARDFGGPGDQAVPDGAEPPPWILARMSQPWRFVIGLGDDMIGYLFPRTNAVGIPLDLSGDTDDTDRFGCGHSDDGEAPGIEAGNLVANALADLLPPQKDMIRVGRYVWSDGTLHRSPIGDGGQACSGPGNAFTPAPGGSATEIWVLPEGVTEFAPGVGFRVQVGVARWWRFMNLRGRPEAQASTQTRGIIDRLGHRLWIDVFPETTGP